MIFNVILILLFIWMNLYYLGNLTKLDVRFSQIDKSSIGLVQYVYYFSRLSYWLWIILSLFLAYNNFIVLLFSFNVIKFLIYPFSKKFYKILNVITPFISIILLVIILLLNIKLF
jgi:hypothetical protein